MKTGTLEYYMSLDYPVEIRKVPADLGGGFSSSIPHLGRMAFFAVGETREESLKELDSVKRELFAHMIEKGKAIPLPPPSPEEEEEVYSGRLLLRLPRDLHRDLAQMAEENGCSINQYATVALAKQISGDQLVHMMAAASEGYFATAVPNQRYMLKERPITDSDDILIYGPSTCGKAVGF